MALTPTQIHPKLAASTIAAALVVVAETAYTQYTHNAVPPGIDAGLALVLGFAAGYIVPSTNADSSLTPVGASDPPTVIVP